MWQLAGPLVTWEMQGALLTSVKYGIHLLHRYSDMLYIVWAKGLFIVESYNVITKTMVNLVNVFFYCTL